MAGFSCHRLDGHGIVRSKLALCFVDKDSMDTEVSATTWRFSYVSIEFSLCQERVSMSSSAKSPSQ